jgi:hypothetical protein
MAADDKMAKTKALRQLYLHSKYGSERERAIVTLVLWFCGSERNRGREEVGEMESYEPDQ